MSGGGLDPFLTFQRVEQPVGTGFAQGTPTATTQEETAKDFADFFLNWQNIFGVSKFKIYITGESYAGRYVPYIAAEMLNRNDTTHYNVSGALVYDPCIGNFAYAQQEVRHPDELHHGQSFKLCC